MGIYKDIYNKVMAQSEREKAAQKEVSSGEQTAADKQTETIKTAEKTDVCELLIDSLIPYPNQPFKPYDDEQLTPLVQSIGKYGILEPLIVRKTEKEKYQIVSGHNRLNAAKRLGFERVPVVVRELDDEQADIILVETNLRSRTKILPSEKAFAFKMQYEAMKRQGKRTDLTSGQVVQKWSSEIIAENSEESEKQIRRYIAITKLNRSFLDLLDSGKLPFVAAVNLSSIDSEIQELIYNFFFIENQLGIDLKISEILKELGDEITREKLEQEFLKAEEKPKRIVNVKIKFRKIKEFFPKETTEKEVEETIIKALEKYFKKEDE